MKAQALFVSIAGCFGLGRGKAGRDATLSVCDDAKGSGARLGGQIKGPFAILALTIIALALMAAPASAAAPVVTIEPASQIGVTSAAVKGEVDPKGKETSYHFEYISDAQLKENEANGDPGFTNAAWAGYAEGITTDTPTEAILEGLKPATAYHLRLIATNEDGTQFALDPNFTTQAAQAPTLALDAPSAVAYTTAHIAATLNPEGGSSNPIGGVLPIYWELQTNHQGEGWVPAEAGAIEGPDAEASAPIAVAKDLDSLVPGSNYKFRLKVTYANFSLEAIKAGGEFTTLAVAAPVVSTEDASAVTGTSAHFSGSVTAGGTDTAFDSSCTFDYATEAQFAEGEFDNPFVGHTDCEAPNNPVTGTASTPVGAQATDLLPSTTYHLRLRSTNAGGPTIATAPDTFTTEAIAPRISGTNATDIALGATTLNARVNPGGAPTTYHFEYLTRADYEANGQTFAGALSTPESPSIGADNKEHAATAQVSGLDPDTAYRFRAVATNAKSPVGGTVGSEVGSLRTNAPASGGGTCPNEVLRAENDSLALPDCRAYELVTPDLNHASGAGQPGGIASADGKTLIYQSIDAPVNAHSTDVFNMVRASRDEASGWSGASLAPVFTTPASAYLATETTSVAKNLASTAVASDQPLGAGPIPAGQNLYVRRPDGSYDLITKVGVPYNPVLRSYRIDGLSWGNTDFSNVYFKSAVAQLPEDPAVSSSLYAWSKEGGLRFLSVLPGETISPSGGNLVGGILQPGSEDGRYVLFETGGELYLRVDDSETRELSPFHPDITQADDVDQGGITPDGSKVVFTSQTELTDDANTNEGAEPQELGRDLYSYDTASREFTDLTVDTNPADPRGADVQRILGTSRDASYVYFTANGKLAPGGTPGQASLYVWHDGEIELVALTRVRLPNGLYFFHVTPDGRHAAFASVDPLTGYDNTDPLSGERHSEVFKYTFGGGLECASCRPDGSRPRGDSLLPSYHGQGQGGAIRTMSEDGARLFFESRDAVLPQASSPFRKIFEYADGRISPISPMNGRTEANFLDASVSGDHVFFNTFDAPVPNSNAGDYAILDAHVDGGFPAPRRVRCEGPSCQGDQSGAPPLGEIGSRALSAPGNRDETKPCGKSKVRRKGKCAKKRRSKAPGKGRHQRPAKGHAGGAK